VASGGIVFVLDNFSKSEPYSYFVFLKCGGTPSSLAGRDGESRFQNRAPPPLVTLAALWRHAGTPTRMINDSSSIHQQSNTSQKKNTITVINNNNNNNNNSSNNEIGTYFK